MIVGGGDSAMEEAIFLSKFACKVTIVHRREEFRASKIMLERARAQANIELLTPYAVKEFVAGENGALGHAALMNTETGEEREIRGRGRVHRGRPRAAVGDRARPGRRRRERLRCHRGPLDAHQPPWRVCRRRPRRSHLPPGDHGAGSGCQAALDAEWYLRDTPGVPEPAEMPAGDPTEAQWAPAMPTVDA